MTKILNINLSPNPAHQFSNLEVKLSHDARLEIEILDITGFKVTSFTLSGKANYEKILALDHLKTGIYFVIVATNTERNNIQLYVQ